MLAHGRGDRISEASLGSRSNDEDVERSNNHRLLGHYARVDWIAVSMIDRPRAEFLFEFIEMDRYPDESSQLLVPVDVRPWPHLQLHSSARCSFLMDHDEKPFHHVRLNRRCRPGPSVFFDSIAMVKVYLSVNEGNEVRLLAKPA